MKFRNETFRKMRQGRRWTVRSFSRKLGVTPATLHMWENGHHSPSIEKVSRMAEILDVAPGELLEQGTDVLDEHLNEKGTESGGSLLKTISSYEKSKLEDSVVAITRNAKFLSEKVKELSVVFNAIMQANPAFSYIKDVSQNYVMASSVFFSTLGLAADYDLRGRKDTDFYPAAEALENYREDEKVMATGVPVRYVEKPIPGTRKSRQGLVFKSPILGVNSKPVGILGTFLDITERKKAEDMVEVLKMALETIDEAIWIGRYPEEQKDGSIRFGEYLYVLNSNFRKHLLDQIRKLDQKKQVEYYYNHIVVEKPRPKHSYKELMKTGRSEITYHIRYPGEKVNIKVVDRIYYVVAMNVFIGVILEPGKRYARKMIDLEFKRHES